MELFGSRLATPFPLVEERKEARMVIYRFQLAERLSGKKKRGCFFLNFVLGNVVRNARKCFSLCEIKGFPSTKPVGEGWRHKLGVWD